ncbi:hypothetical protein E2C01_072941 [Portunus trituberculatus]|uniref:Uncharacterized protein n=1 Tax=Portunus trituberculatus TaxID=210409 RepID=A0A5B7I8J0_PORTR|nr:hypothetical protein [Portunus trituberculatus]
MRSLLFFTKLLACVTGLPEPTQGESQDSGSGRQTLAIQTPPDSSGPQATLVSQTTSLT